MAWAESKTFLVVIDPGHGGEDYGASAGEGKSRIYEKDATLILAQALALELKKKNIRAVLTRNMDKSVELNERTAIANRLEADLFISLHMNSAGHGHASQQTEGVETFILNTTTNRTSARLAAMENSVLNGSVADAFQNAEVSLIVKDLLINSNLHSSKHAACRIQEALVSTLGKSGKSVRDRGVKQALFYVLLGADMPSVLVEAGFITHKKDRTRVISPSSRQKMAASLAQAIDEFQKSRNSAEASKFLTSCRVY